MNRRSWSLCRCAVASLGLVSAGELKLVFHCDQFPRNFPVANVTGKSPVTRKLRGSWRRRQQVREEVTGKLVPLEFEL